MPVIVEPTATNTQCVASLIVIPGEQILVVGKDIEQIVGRVITQLAVQLIGCEVTLTCALLVTSGSVFRLRV